VPYLSSSSSGLSLPSRPASSVRVRKRRLASSATAVTPATGAAARATLLKTGADLLTNPPTERPAFLINLKFPVSLLRGRRIKNYGSPEGTMFPLVKGGVNTPPAKLACGASATPPLFFRGRQSPPFFINTPEANMNR